MKLLVTFLLAAGFALPAGDPPGFYQWKGADLKAIATTLAPKLPASQYTGESYGKAETYSFTANLRRVSGGAEIHKKWTDVFVIQSGEATLIVGGTIPGAKESRPGEFNGPAVADGVEKKLGPGDIIAIPAGTPHQIKVEPGKEIAMLVIKIATPETPAAK
ncbi:MAG TPA: cupin domain-containing protein [Bryobacteraceae bacterium]|nr:cupin domain-containing protein [Bryobacteraceae bacterium]